MKIVDKAVFVNGWFAFVSAIALICLALLAPRDNPEAITTIYPWSRYVMALVVGGLFIAISAKCFKDSIRK